VRSRKSVSHDGTQSSAALAGSAPAVLTWSLKSELFTLDAIASNTSSIEEFLKKCRKAGWTVFKLTYNAIENALVNAFWTVFSVRRGTGLPQHGFLHAWSHIAKVMRDSSPVSLRS